MLITYTTLKQMLTVTCLKLSVASWTFPDYWLCDWVEQWNLLRGLCWSKSRIQTDAMSMCLESWESLFLFLSTTDGENVVFMCLQLEINSISNNRYFIMFNSLVHKILLNIWNDSDIYSLFGVSELPSNGFILPVEWEAPLSLTVCNLKQYKELWLTIWTTEVHSWFMPVHDPSVHCSVWVILFLERLLRCL